MGEGSTGASDVDVTVPALAQEPLPSRGSSHGPKAPAFRIERGLWTHEGNKTKIFLFLCVSFTSTIGGGADKPGNGREYLDQKWRTWPAWPELWAVWRGRVLGASGSTSPGRADTGTSSNSTGDRSADPGSRQARFPASGEEGLLAGEKGRNFSEQTREG